MSKRRRRRLVHYKIQSALALQACLHWTLFLLAAFGLLFVWQMFTENPYRPMSEHWQVFLHRHGAVGVILITLLPVFIYQTVKLSNRFLGPLVRLRNALRRLADGEKVEPLGARKRDFGRDFIEAFNYLLVQLQREREERAATAMPDGPRGEPARSTARQNADSLSA